MVAPGFPDDELFREEDKWAVNPARKAQQRQRNGGGTTGMASAKGAPANTGARSTQGSVPLVPNGDDHRTAWDSLAVVAGTLAGAVIATVGWWGAWKVIERAWEKRGRRGR